MTGDWGALCKDLAAGTVGGATALVVGFPLDTIKVKMQACSVEGGGKGPLEVAHRIAAREGVKGFFRGLAVPLVTMACFNSVVFGTRGAIERVLDRGTPSTVADQGLAGLGAGAAAAAIVCPTELIKVRMQTSTAASPTRSPSILGRLWPAPKLVAAPRTPAAVLGEVLKLQGVAGLYKGMGPTLARELPGMSAKFAAYEGAKQGLVKAYGLEGTQDLSALQLMAAGGLSGSVYWGLVYPADVVKCLVQADSADRPRYTRGMIDTARQTGIRGLYRGFWVAMLRSVPVTAVNFGTYETVRAALG